MIRLKEIKFVAFLMAITMLIACQEDSEPQSLTPQLFVNEVQVLNSDKFFLSGSYDPYGTETVTTATFYYGTTEAMEQSITARLTGRTATAILEGLQAGTTYYYCLEIGNGADSRRSEVRQFTTEGQKQVSALKNATLISAVEAQLSRSFQKEADGTVLLDNVYNERLVEMVTSLYLDDKDDPTICDEIGVFANLRILSCAGNGIQYLDLSKNIYLEELWCDGREIVRKNDFGDDEHVGYNGSLMTLNLTNCKALLKLRIKGNMLTSLDLSDCVNLREMSCEENSLKSLDISKNIALESLLCNDNPIGTLDVSHNTEFSFLECTNCNLTTLDVSHNLKLTALNIPRNHIESIDVSMLTLLTNLDIANNPITYIDLSHNIMLEEFIDSSSHLKNIDLSQLPNLRVLDLNVNELSTIDISHNPNLEYLNCQYGPLKELDISHNPMLAYLECHGCQLTSLDLSNNHEIIWLQCHENHMTELDVSMISDNADILAGNQHTEGGVPLSLTLYVNQAQYNREPGTGPYYMDKYNEAQQDRVTVVVKQ